MPVYRRPYSARHLYTGSWPARVWDLFPPSRRVHLLRHQVAAGRSGGASLRIAFASDLHLGPTTPPRVLDRAFALLCEAQPDVLALGGDYVFLGATHERVRELVARVRDVPAALKVAVLGNHDFWARPERIEDALSAVGVRVLVDDALTLPAPHDDVALVGLDDPLTLRGVREPVVDRTAVEAAFDSVRHAAVKFVLCHSPDGVPAARGRSVRLFLCGHTHGGHVALPGDRPIWMPSPHGKLWPWGRHEVDGMTLIVSRGVGGSVLPFRVYAPPDVLAIDLV